MLRKTRQEQTLGEIGNARSLKRTRGALASGFKGRFNRTLDRAKRPSKATPSRRAAKCRMKKRFGLAISQRYLTCHQR